MSVYNFVLVRSRAERSRSRSPSGREARRDGQTRGRRQRSRSRSRNRKKSPGDSRSPVSRKTSRSPDISQYGKLNRTTIAYATSLAAELSKRRKQIEMKQAQEKKSAAKDDQATEAAVKLNEKASESAACPSTQETAGKAKEGPVISGHRVDFGEEVKLIALPPAPLPPPTRKMESKPSPVSSAPAAPVATPNKQEPSDDSPSDKQAEKDAALGVGDVPPAKKPTVTSVHAGTVAAETTVKSANDGVTRSAVAERATPPARLTDLPMPPVIEDDCDSINEESAVTRYTLISTSMHQLYFSFTMVKF